MAKINESELNARYIQASHRFAQTTEWKVYLELADEFRALDTYKDSAQMYMKCIKAASAPAYRQIKANLESLEEPTADDYREAARIMLIIQDYQDARETARVYTVKANALTYNEAMSLVNNSQATTEELARGVELFRSIKGFKNSRDMIERYERFYCEKVYAEAAELMQHGHVFSEFDEAAELFDKIPQYADAADLAAACKKKANQLRPKHRKAPKAEKEPEAKAEEKEKETGDGAVKLSKEQRKALKKQQKSGQSPAEGQTTETVRKPRRTADETTNGFVEVWKQLDKRYLALTIFLLLLFVAALYASIWIAKEAAADEHGWIAAHLTALRGACIVVYIASAILCVRYFVRMLTKSMRRRLAQSALAVAKKLASPLIKAVTKLLNSIGIDLTRRNRLNGRDEKSIVYTDENKEKKAKKKLKNDLKWSEQPDNAARVRFIFIDYMIRRIKNGYFMRRTMTPVEIGRDIALEDDEKELFRVYNMARYAGNTDANSEISNALVGELRAVNQRRS